MTLLTHLAEQALYKRSLLVEEFIFKHWSCFPKPDLIYTEPIDRLVQIIKCGCGQQLEATIVISVVPQVHGTR